MTAGNANHGATDASSIPYARFNAMRAEVVESIRGRVLELGAGRGVNFDSLARSVDWTGLEPRPKTRAQLASRAAQYGHVREPLAAEAEAIPLPDDSIDAVLPHTCSVRSLTPKACLPKSGVCSFQGDDWCSSIMWSRTHQP